MIFPRKYSIFWCVHGFIDFVYISELLYFQWKSEHFGAFTDSSFLTIFHFCHTSLLIFKILMLIFEMLIFARTSDKNELRLASRPASRPEAASRPPASWPQQAGQPTSQAASQPRLQKRYVFFHKAITNPSLLAQIQPCHFLTSQPASLASPASPAGQPSQPASLASQLAGWPGSSQPSRPA